MQQLSIANLYLYALAEGEGVGTAYEYFVKRRALRRLLADFRPKSILIAGLPQKYGHSLDFFLLAHEFGAQLTVVDDRADKLAATAALLKRVQADGLLPGLQPTMVAINSLATLDLAAGSFDLVLSSEVLQRLDSPEQRAFSSDLQRVATHYALFCPNGDNNAHVGLSGLEGLSLVQLKRLFSTASAIGLIDMPPFPPGIALSQEQREQAQSGLLQQIAIAGLQVYSAFEQLLPRAIRRRYAHIVYSFH